MTDFDNDLEQEKYLTILNDLATELVQKYMESPFYENLVFHIEGHLVIIEMDDDDDDDWRDIPTITPELPDGKIKAWVK